MKDKLSGKIKKQFLGLTAKTDSYLIDDGSEVKKAKVTKKCVIKNLSLEATVCLESIQFENKIIQLEKNKVR